MKTLQDETGETEMDSVPTPLRKVADGAAHAAAFLLQLGAAGILVNAIYRYGFGGGFPLISELSRFVLLIVVFLGLAATHLVGGHVQVQLLLSALPPRPRRLISGYFVPLASLFFLALIAYSGAMSVIHMFEQGTTTPSRPPVLLWPIMVVVPLGSGLLMLVLFLGLVRRLLGRPA